MSITRRSSCGDEVKLAIASGAKIHFKLSTDSGSISVHYDNVSYSTSGFHTGNGDDFETGSGKEVNVSVTDGDIIITNK
jgi:DUF4097 and DUF4098 domain-containing protein YvlB